ncbi:IS110 family transposase [Staphylococcus pseudintermedius]|nr:IS110 family transposase [Staphylococcus pseudintermedius]ELJ9259365.1 IS110 family transposase [Staphylococcus pseudintermedius]ELJ9314095.1 IS110 family transposase [Staphylococcus pseudintermedius]
MDNVYRSCAGIDIHQNNVVACVLVGPLTSTRPKKYEATFKTTTRDLEALNHWLKSFGVEAVGMESTGVYWKPIWHALINDFKLILANPQRIKNIPGQKTDKKDAYWIAKLTRIDLIPASFVPDENIQALRNLTRQRIHYIESRNTEKNRVHKILQCGGIKLTSYIKDVFGKSGRNLLDMLMNGEVITLKKIQNSVYTSLKNKTQDLYDAMDGYLSKVDRFLLKQAMMIIDTYNEAIESIEEQIDEQLKIYEEELEVLDSIPGIDKIAASIIIAEIGDDVSQFPTANHLASWAGLCPGNNESSGKKKSTRIRKGNRYLKNICAKQLL